MAERGTPQSVINVFQFQADACARSGSPLYGRILDGVVEDLRAGGVCAELLGERDDDPFASALALRFLGAAHRLVLEGRAPGLARFYPSVGGDAGLDGVVPAFLDALRAHQGELALRIDDGVQTNEVGRSAVLVGGHAEVARLTGLPLRVLELGASAGLNLRFDHYAYDTGRGWCGDPASPVRFAGVWEGEAPDLPARIDVAERRGCDRNPIDATSDHGRLTLLSYTWPDQPDRIERLLAAIEVARRVPAPVEEAGAADWIESALARPRSGVATVVTHSIVLQYLSPTDRARVRGAIETAGRTASREAPLAWLRMEPAGDRAELRLTTWPGGDERILATSGYHGRPIWWEAPIRART